MKIRTCLLIIPVATTFATAQNDHDTVGAEKVKREDPNIAEALADPMALGPIADAFNDALHTEEVARDLDAAAVKFEAIVNKYRKQTDNWGKGVAAQSLFRLAEIRRKQGKEEEARKLYEEVLADFKDWEPMASLSRQQLGLDPSDFFPKVRRIENDRPLSDTVERSLWEVRTRVCDDKFVLVTFKAEPEEKEAYEDKPDGYEIQTLHYNPVGAMSGFISSTSLKGDAVKVGKILGTPIRGTLGTRVAGFGHSYDVPSGLRRTAAISMADSNWIGLRESSFDAKVSMIFKDEMDEKSKELKVVFTLATISEAKARELTESRSMTLPELDEKGWALTLPPSPGQMEEARGDE